MINKSFAFGWALLASSLFSVSCSSDHDSTRSDRTNCLVGAEEPEHIACNSCLKRSCDSDYSALCAAHCEASSSSTTCTQATEALAICGIQQCAAECDVEDSSNGSSSAGSSNAGSSSAGSSSAGSSNAGSSRAGSSSAGSSSAGSSNAGGGASGASGSTTATASCYRSVDSVCTRTEVAKGFLSQYDEACTQQNGQPVCPPGIVGCCKLGGSKLCVYSAKIFDETSCPQIGGVWSSN